MLDGRNINKYADQGINLVVYNCKHEQDTNNVWHPASNVQVVIVMLFRFQRASDSFILASYHLFISAAAWRRP